MSETLIREVAQAVATEQFHLHWRLYAVWLAVAVILVAGAAFLAAYAQRRGAALATKADFNLLLDQLKATTAVAEQVKAQVSHSDWASREFKTLRRVKLEELLLVAREMQDWQDALRRHCVFNDGTPPRPSPVQKGQVLTGLYFPELTRPAGEFFRGHFQLSMVLHQVQGELSRLRADPAACVQRRKAFNEEWKPLYKEQLDRLKVMEDQARLVMFKLVGVSSEEDGADVGVSQQ